MSVSIKSLILILSASLLACGGGGGGGSPAPTPAASPTPAPTPAPTPEPTPSPSTAPSISVDAEALQFNATQQSEGLAVSSTETWTAAASAPWLALSATSGSGEQDVTVTAEANPYQWSRSATLSFDMGEYSASVVVEQAAAGIDYDVPLVDTDMSTLSSVAFAATLGEGYNIGNSLEAVGGETAWGNPLINAELIAGIKAAGFDTVRLPVAWSQFSDEDRYTIDAQWMARVQEVVDMLLAADLTVLMNLHWDGGWMQPTYADQDVVNYRLSVMWKQIATHFRDYDSRLMFAGTNEVMVEGDYGTPTEEYYTVQNSFNQTFVDTVRDTGGRNAVRHLVVQGFNTNIDHTVNFAEIPDDTLVSRLLMEVHFYDPFSFTLDLESDVTQWGNDAENSSATAGWGDEAHVDAQFGKMKQHFVDQGIGVILGEYGVSARLTVEGHDSYRVSWLNYVTDSARAHGLVPYVWDNGYVTDGQMGLFHRATGEEAFPALIDAITETE